MPSYQPRLTTSQDYSHFLSSHGSSTYDDISNLANPNAPPHHQQPSRRAQQAQLSAHNSTHARPHSLAQLKADEDAIRKRKENIARFGSTWIKPPGVAKTLQAETEEKQEREEQEALQRREQMMMDLQAQQEAEEARQRMEAQAAAEGEEGGTGEQERDLDEEIPDADEEEVSVLTSEDEEGEEGEEGAVDVTFNEESMIEGSMMVEEQGGVSLLQEENQERDLDYEHEVQEQERYLQLEEAEITGVAQDQYDLGMEANLDDSVPEAGSYEHTDTELDVDDSDEDEESIMAPPPPAGRVSSHGSAQTSAVIQGGLFRSMRSRESGESRTSTGSREPSSLLESSFVSSSPVLGRLRSTNSNTRRSR